MAAGTGTPFLPYGRQSLDEDDIAAVEAVLRSDWLTLGPTVAEFEAALAATTGAAHAVVCNSGTAALHLAVLAAGVGDGDLAVVPAVTFLATANAVRYVGGEVVFADVDPDTGLMEPAHLESALLRAAIDFPGRPVKAVLPVHLNGQAGDLAGLAALARGTAATVIEDACHFVGGEVRSADGTWTPAGSVGHGGLACFSFHPVKTVAMGEGGAVTTNDPAAAERMRRLRSHGVLRDSEAFTCPDQAFATDGAVNSWYYEMPELGFNYRASDLQCALGLSQLRKLPRFVERRRALRALYAERLAPLAPLVRPVPVRDGACRPSWHLSVALVDFAAAGRDRATVMAGLRGAGIGTQVHYLPVSHQPYYRARYGRPDLPGAETYYSRCLSLPLFVDMSEADVDRVVDALAAALGAAARGATG